MRKMVERGEDCTEVLVQLAAVISARYFSACASSGCHSASINLALSISGRLMMLIQSVR